MKRELARAGMATAVVVGGIFAASAAVAQTGGGDASTQAVIAADGTVKDRDAARERAQRFAAQDEVAVGDVTRVFGADRYETAAVIAERYLWDETNTFVVYIANGRQPADALTIGPSMMGDGPLLLVRPDGIPPATRAALERLQPCWIDVMGGTAAVQDKVVNELATYADSSLCFFEE